MKITKKYLQKLISEEYAKIVKEQLFDDATSRPMSAGREASARDLESRHLLKAFQAMEALTDLAAKNEARQYSGLLGSPMESHLSMELKDDFKSVEELSVVEFLRSVEFLLKQLTFISADADVDFTKP